MKSSIGAVLLGVGMAAVPVLAKAVEADWSLRLKLAGLGEGARDLGRSTQDTAPPGTTEIEETTEAYLDANGSLLLKFSDNFSTYVRLQGYAPTGETYQEEDNRVVRAKGFGALREAWMEIGGITSYPGEVLRLGLQRVRWNDGLWWDRDIESARWIFDTTLLQFQIGAAQQFSSYRTDDVDLPVSQEDRPYGFVSFGGQWLPGNFVTVRATHASERGELQEVQSPPAAPDPEKKQQQRKYTWVGLNFNNGFYEIDSPPTVAYWLEGVLLTGSREATVVTEDTTVTPPTTTVTGLKDEDVRALGGDAGLRFNIPNAFSFGVAYAYGQGGGTADRRETFEQTGVQSNRSRFTGTRSLIYRFNEALQADLTNLRVATGYFSIPMERFDLSAIYHRFQMDDPGSAIVVDGIDVRPSATNTSRDLGNGYDLVTAWYFGMPGSSYGWGEDVRNNVRLRGSLFQPGEAFREEDDNQYRVMLEVTLWF